MDIDVNTQYRNSFKKQARNERTNTKHPNKTKTSAYIRLKTASTNAEIQKEKEGKEIKPLPASK